MAFRLQLDPGQGQWVVSERCCEILVLSLRFPDDIIVTGGTAVIGGATWFIDNSLDITRTPLAVEVDDAISCEVLSDPAQLAGLSRGQRGGLVNGDVQR